MSALQQYIELYRHHKQLVEQHSAPALNDLRPKALEALENMALPLHGSENYEATDLNAILAPDYGINLQRVKIPADPESSFHCGVPSLSSLLLFEVNDIFAKAKGVESDEMPGIYAGSLRELALKEPELVRKHYGRLADIANPVVALDTLLAQDGIAIWVKKGVKVDMPIQTVNILQNAAPLMAVRRVLIIAEEGAEVKILSCDHTQNPQVDFLSLQAIEIFAGKNSVVDFYDLEESSEKTHRLSALYLRQEQGSNVQINGMTLYNGITRNEYYTEFEGSDASLRLYGMGIEDHKRRLDNYSRITHKVGHCKTDELFKYVVDDEALGAFAGLIHVLEGADKTEAYQSNRNIVGSDTARMLSKPQLEIYNDDVKCSHGTATGQLDELQVFYMRTRGLPEESAKLLLKQAFMADVIDGVRLQSLRERLHMLVERRFTGAELSCASCQGGCERKS